MLKVLYIDGDGPFGGASRSLFEAIRGMPAGAIDPHFLSSRGTAQDLYRKVAKSMISVRAMSKFDNTLYGFYRGMRWLILLRELANLPASVFGVLVARYRLGKVNLLHLNEITYIVPALVAKVVFKAPLVVHVRSLQNSDAKSLRTRLVVSMLKRYAAKVVAIDENVRQSMPGLAEVSVVHNSLSQTSPVDPDLRIRAQLDSIGPKALTVGFVGNLHHSKGLFDLLEAAKVLRSRKTDVRFLIVGENTTTNAGLKSRILSQLGFEQNVGVSLHEMVLQGQLTDSFHLLGPTKDIRCVYEAIDVLCFPSHYDAPGRPVFEAAFSGVASIVAVGNPLPDTFADGQTGIAVPMRSPIAIADAVDYFAKSPSELRRMGDNARRLAEENFCPEKNSSRLLGVYRAAIDSVETRTAVSKRD